MKVSKFSCETRYASLSRCHLLDLPWEDVLVPHILCHLPLQHLVSLQRVSKQFHSLIQVYLANCRTFDLSMVSSDERNLLKDKYTQKGRVQSICTHPHFDGESGEVLSSTKQLAVSQGSLKVDGE